ncbi:putative Chaperone J-domain superfamily [Helianthus annuus]|nr:putative Chaperone J-domain superfamily [Helianthus annuus]
MEKVSRPANLSLRYSLTHRSFENLNKASSSSVRNSDNDDVDFDDVFGGPPTRTRYSFGSGRVKSEEESSSSPVFGESYSSPRTRTSDDFYDDIFRRSDESVREPFATSVPSDFSLPPKITEDAGIPVFGSNVHTPSTTLSRFSSTTTQKFRNNSGQSPGQTLLSREASNAKESLHSTRSTGSEVDDTSKAKTTGTKSPSNEFHFSIHKWPSVGESGFPNEDLSAKKEDVKMTEKETLAVKQEENVQEVVAPSSLLHDELERKGYEDAGKEAETKEKMQTTSGKKKPDAKKTSSSKKAESNKPGAGSPKNRVKGMVKDFFKMSNQESPPKTKTNVSSRWKTGGKKNTTQEEVNDTTSNLDTNAKTKTDASKTTKLASGLPAEKVKISPDASRTIPLDVKTPAENVKSAPDASNMTPLNGKMPAENENKMPDASFMAKEETGRSNKQKFSQNRPIRKLEDINFQQDTTPSSESVPNGSKTSGVNIDDPTLDNFQVQELTTVDDKTSKTQEESEAIMALDSKIHTWSSGRKGNIRSLLSTLQLVLWAESGWKPVALVDIIEANAVKKAYNRAMLCLHPDKLQQKGADSNKKYIAEKVFDILQEAWDHFNTLGTLL